MRPARTILIMQLSNSRDQVSLVPAFQFRRTELPESSKHLMPYDRQQLKCNKMVTVLFSVMEIDHKIENFFQFSFSLKYQIR